MKQINQVWVVEAVTPYEGGCVVGVYSSESGAKLKAKKIQSRINSYNKAYAKYEKAYDLGVTDELMPKLPKFPECFGDDIVISRRKLIH